MPATARDRRGATSAASSASVAVWLIAPFVLGIPLAQGADQNSSNSYRFNDAARSLAETERNKDFDKAVKAYERGDYPAALRLLRPLAQQGNAEAQNNLGLMYAKGHGVPKDYAAAAKWYRMAADKGVASAQNNLAVMYTGGQGVKQDYIQAYMWFTLAASSFAGSEAEERNKVVKNRDALAADMTQAEINEGQKLAREWKPR